MAKNQEGKIPMPNPARVEVSEAYHCIVEICSLANVEQRPALAAQMHLNTIFCACSWSCEGNSVG
jgi:hypothetical protein